jgi:hypothetical protein
MTESEKELTNSGYRLLTPDQADYENFLSETSFPIIRTRSNGDGTGAPFFLLFSAFGFFFSRLLLNWPFATLSSLVGVNAALRSPAHHRCTCRAVGRCRRQPAERSPKRSWFCRAALGRFSESVLSLVGLSSRLCGTTGT